MRFNHIVTVSTLTMSETSGHASESWSTPVTIRAKVTQIDGTRYLKEDELIDRAVYKIECYNNSYDVNTRFVYGSLTLYPIRPLLTNRDDKSWNTLATIIAATKK